MLDCSTTKREPIPKDVCSGSSRRDVPKAVLFGTDPIPSVEISSMVNRAGGGVIHSVVEGNLLHPL